VSAEVRSQVNQLIFGYGPAGNKHATNELRESEANKIVEAIRQYYPQLVLKSTPIEESPIEESL
jgi:hypothetical protein